MSNSARNGKNKFRWKMAVFVGSGGSNLQNQKIHVCYHKSQLLSVITYPLNPITKSIITIYADVTEHPPHFIFFSIILHWQQ